MNPTPNPHTPREFVTEPGALLTLPNGERLRPPRTPREALAEAYVQTLTLAASLRRAMDALDAAANPTNRPGVSPNWPA